MIRLLESMSCPRLGQSERFIVREGGTKAKGVMPTEKKRQDQEIWDRTIDNLTSFVKSWFPDTRDRLPVWVCEDESEDFVWIGV